MSVFGLKGNIKKSKGTSVPATKRSLFAWTKDVGDAIRGYKKTGQYLLLFDIVMGTLIVAYVFYRALMRWIVPYGPWITLGVIIAGGILLVGAMSFVGAHAFIHVRKKHILAQLEIDAKRQSMQLIVFNQPGYLNTGDRMIWVDGTQKEIDLTRKEITGSLTPSAPLPAVIPLPAAYSQNMQFSDNTKDQQVITQTGPVIQKKASEPLIHSIVLEPANVAESIKLDDEPYSDFADVATMQEEEPSIAHEEDIARNFAFHPGTEKDNPKGNILPKFPEPKTFGDFLKTGWLPTKSSILLADTLTDGPLFRSIGSMGHIGLFGKTGSGKGNLSRSLIVQAIKSGAEVYIADIHFMPIRLNRGTVEDWRPVMDKLPQIEGIPNPARKIEDIEALMTWFHALYQRLIEESQLKQVVWKNRFLFLLEWPAISNRVGDDALELLGFFLREIAKFNMHIVVESHGALVGTTGGNTDLRENYTTRCLLDENAKSSSALFGKIYDVRGLGKKGTMLAATDKEKVYRSRTPFMSNADVYAILNPTWVDRLDDHDLSPFEEEGEEKPAPLQPTVRATPPRPILQRPDLKLIQNIDEALAVEGDISFIPDTAPRDTEFIKGIGNVPKSLVASVKDAANQVRARKHIQRLEVIPEDYRGGGKYYIIAAICNHYGLLMDEVKTDKIG